MCTKFMEIFIFLKILANLEYKIYCKAESIERDFYQGLKYVPHFQNFRFGEIAS
jgi:hypothetical protein